MTGGAWTVDDLSTVGLSSGTYNVHAVVTSADGTLVSAVSSPVAITIDHSVPTTTFGAIAISRDTGSSATDFITNVAAQTISVTLSQALQAGDTVWGATGNCLNWRDIVDGTSLTWTAATLVFAKLIQDEEAQKPNAGGRARGELLEQLTAATKSLR